MTALPGTLSSRPFLFIIMGNPGKTVRLFLTLKNGTAWKQRDVLSLKLPWNLGGGLWTLDTSPPHPLTPGKIAAACSASWAPLVRMEGLTPRKDRDGWSRVGLGIHYYNRCERGLRIGSAAMCQSQRTRDPWAQPWVEGSS